MSNLNELIELLKQFIENSMAPKNGWDIFIIYMLPIIQVVIILFGSIAGLWKYYSTKNKEINEKILNEVYAPIFQYLIKQELYRKIYKLDGDYKETPILEITTTIRSNKNGNS